MSKLHSNQRVIRGSASYYETCKSCKHVFKPKKMNKRLLESRMICLCACHWSDEFDWATGITFEQAKTLVTLRRNGND